MEDNFNAVQLLANGETGIDDGLLGDSYRQIRKDSLFLETHQSEWLKRYPDTYVAVYQEKLVGVAATVDELDEQLRAKGVPAGKSCWRFLASDNLDSVMPVKRTILAPANRMRLID